jgi:hypothetical protein
MVDVCPRSFPASKITVEIQTCVPEKFSCFQIALQTRNFLPPLCSENLIDDDPMSGLARSFSQKKRLLKCYGLPPIFSLLEKSGMLDCGYGSPVFKI